ncbi:hypothetical protein PHJA_000526000 [Phtheirospermum japonicum]|uniref:BED-type domain-containing protein n=1 Tax=Phtheirospermum japonicum TaxID=374723 RepID=A0A830BIV8_9LAMI|nr:hypothetical protein PHJA_000526000 [Phtheirospermum japonicum]
MRLEASEADASKKNLQEEIRQEGEETAAELAAELAGEERGARRNWLEKREERGGSRLRRKETATVLKMSGRRNKGNKKDNRKDPTWKYCIEVKGPGKGYKYVKCNFCKKVITEGVSRLKEHLAGTHRDSKPCVMVTVEVRNEMKEYLKKSDEAKSFKEREFDEMVGVGSYFNNHASIGKGDSMKGSSSSRGFRGPMDHYVNNIIIDEDVAIPTEEKGNQMSAKEARKLTALDVGRFFVENGIPFNVANSPSYVNMMRSVGNYGRGFKPQTTYKLSTWILKEEVATIDAIVDDLLDEVVEEVGEDIVVQVVTDNASNYKLAGKKLMEKRTRLWWTPCAAHCIDLMLEKIGSLPQHKNALLKAKKGWVLALMRKHAGRDLLHSAATRFATAYLTLQNILDMSQPLEAISASVEWSQSSYSRKDEDKAVKKIIFDHAFWLSVAYAIKTTKPLVQVLRMTHSEKMPGMGFLYGTMDKAKEEIAKNSGGEEGSYKELWNIIDEKCEFQMHHHLHAAAAEAYALRQMRLEVSEADASKEVKISPETYLSSRSAVATLLSLLQPVPPPIPPLYLLLLAGSPLAGSSSSDAAFFF